jgi:hypothetical protein
MDERWTRQVIYLIKTERTTYIKILHAVIILDRNLSLMQTAFYCEDAKVTERRTNRAALSLSLADVQFRGRRLIGMALLFFKKAL